MSEAENDFFEREDPATQAKKELGEKQRQAQAEVEKRRTALIQCFGTPEGQAALSVMRELAELKALSPIEIRDADKATQTMWWIAGRVSIVGEIEAILAKEAKR